mgnify:CR=1 FL=1
MKGDCATEREGENGVVEIVLENVRENVTEIEHGDE